MMLALEITFIACLTLVAAVTVCGWVYAVIVLWADDNAADDYLGDQIRGDER